MKGTGRLLVVPVAALVLLVIATTLFYGGRYQAPQRPLPPLEKLTLPSYVSPPLQETPIKRRGTLLVDMTHWNDFSEWELNTLLSRVADRGYNIQRLGNVWIRYGEERLKEREAMLEAGLRSADSYLVALPWDDSSPRERELVRAFVDKGGRVLLIADATRRNNINTIAADYGIIFEDDYLYNVKEHETNFQNIFLRDFRPGGLTQGLTVIVFYVSRSITPEMQGIIFTDDNTFSSLRERRGRFAVAALAGQGRVLGISDFTFMTPPYNSMVDNDRLISNIADFLTLSERVFLLAEFPHFFGPEVDVISSNDRLLPSAQSLVGFLIATGRRAEVGQRESFLNETAFLGLWDDAPKVEHYLSSGGIYIGKTIRTPFQADTSRRDTALIYLYENQRRHKLIVLGDSEEMVNGAVARLQSGAFRRDMVSDTLTVYRVARPPTPEPTPPKPEKGGTDGKD